MIRVSIYFSFNNKMFNDVAIKILAHIFMTAACGLFESNLSFCTQESAVVFIYNTVQHKFCLIQKKKTITKINCWSFVIFTIMMSQYSVSMSKSFPESTCTN